MFGLGGGELLLIFVIALLFLGPKKIPELAKGLGQAVREFQKARDEMMSEINKPAPNAMNDAKKDIEVTAHTVEVQDEKKSESPKQS